MRGIFVVTLLCMLAFAMASAPAAEDILSHRILANRAHQRSSDKYVYAEIVDENNEPVSILVCVCVAEN